MELESLDSENSAFIENGQVIGINGELGKKAGKDGERKTERDNWGSRMEFLLAIIGFTVGIGSIWRFPILCARNGGGAFLIPFFFFMITYGGPLYYLEVCLGQFTGQSAGAAFEFCPLFRGIGFLMVMISFDILWYYVSIMGWIQYYFVQSFQSELPWSTCGNWWNTENCRGNYRIKINLSWMICENALFSSCCMALLERRKKDKVSTGLLVYGLLFCRVTFSLPTSRRAIRRKQVIWRVAAEERTKIDIFSHDTN